MFFLFGRHKRQAYRNMPSADKLFYLMDPDGYDQMCESQERRRRNQAEIEVFLRQGRQYAADVHEQAVRDAWSRANASQISREERDSLCYEARKEFDTAWKTLRQLAETRYNFWDVCAAARQID